MVGDLVFVKGDDTEKVKKGVSIEPEDVSCEDLCEPNPLDEVLETDLSEEKDDLVKVRFYCC